MNHQQLIKLRGKHDAAQEVKGILRSQIKHKNEKELKERQEKINVN